VLRSAPGGCIVQASGRSQKVMITPCADHVAEISSGHRHDEGLASLDSGASFCSSHRRKLRKGSPCQQPRSGKIPHSTRVPPAPPPVFVPIQWPPRRRRIVRFFRAGMGVARDAWAV
jgi:hypothetical protein